ncbi:MAG: hypothetical protein DMF83_04330 [Acidobacteria bacterium]|nr:MAG: hypothetical protein DMF83_04330 [Acidobacteriota bacterium]
MRMYPSIQRRTAMFSRRSRGPAGPDLALLVALTAMILASAVPSEAQDRTTPGETVSYSTIHSIGIEWGISGDANHNATVTVHYRAPGTGPWKAALPLVRVDNTYNGNGFAGSILFLDPDTTYKVRLDLSDPDGGRDGSRTLTVATRPLPTLPTGGRRFHVVPGSGGGNGSAKKPFQGIAAAQAVARPGDTFFVHAGSYGGRPTFSVPGIAGNYIVWMGAGDGEALFVDGYNFGASHIWVEGLTVRDQAFATFSLDCPSDVVVRRNFFYDNHYNIYLQRGGEGWYIADNTIVGDVDPASGSFDGEGIELNGSFAACGANNHTVAHNSITRVADGISTPGTNVDIFGNDIFDTSDDGIETDEGQTNVRVWGNRIHNAVHNAFSFQPQIGAPWYFIRNQVINNLEDINKYRQWDRAVILHNTFVHWGDLTTGGAHGLLMSISRNNLWISVNGGQIWWGFGTFDWRTDLDHDGFDWGDSTRPFFFNGTTYTSLESFSAGTGQEANGIRISHQTCIPTMDVPGDSPTTVPPQYLTLAAGCPAIDAGAILPNINDGFRGSAPDLGAYEAGRRLPTYGPRPNASGEDDDDDGDND